MLNGLWRGWLVVARTLGRLQARLLLTVVYFVVLAPFALAVRLFLDPMRLRETSSWHWYREGERPAPDLEWARRQF